ncbi:hypothetical protein RUM44_010844 [Polyplax serrata]|uniref:Uncharacterized protein n=1 Tax=Polyplax serrata TaxID=468196 RepID=A0ABR1AP15_POLSC
MKKKRRRTKVVRDFSRANDGRQRKGQKFDSKKQRKNLDGGHSKGDILNVRSEERDIGRRKDNEDDGTGTGRKKENSNGQVRGKTGKMGTAAELRKDRQKKRKK